MNIMRTFCNESVNGGARVNLTMLKFIFLFYFIKKFIKNQKGIFISPFDFTCIRLHA